MSGLNIIATRARPGAISLSRSSHLPPTENSVPLKPVRLPPGLGRLATKPCATGSETRTKTTGTVLVACRTTSRLTVVTARITSGISPISCEVGQSIMLVLRPAILDHDILALDVAGFTNALPECGQAYTIARRI